MRCQWPATLTASRFCRAVRGLVIKVIVIIINWHRESTLSSTMLSTSAWRWEKKLRFTFTFSNKVFSETLERYNNRSWTFSHFHFHDNRVVSGTWWRSWLCWSWGRSSSASVATIAPSRIWRAETGSSNVKDMDYFKLVGSEHWMHFLNKIWWW